MTKTERLLCELVALPSVNPAFLPAQHPRAGEGRVAQFLAATAERAGLEVTFQPVLPGCPNILARLRPSNRPRQRILLAPHLDTVNAADAQFTPRIVNGRLYGRGASDAKGCIAAMLDALCELARSKQRPAQTEIVLTGLVDEENAQTGAWALADSGYKANLAIVGEPTRERVVTAHKGDLWLELRTRGKSAHGARPELGRNAVRAMARVVELLETRYATDLRRRRHPLLGTATVSVGVIRGGTQPNIVPDECLLQIDRRTLPGETEASVRREIKSLLRQSHLHVDIANRKTIQCLPLETDPKIPLVAEFLRCNRQREPAGVHYYCDASVLAQGGIPSVMFGPGDIAQGHTADEWISLAALERARARLFRFLQSLP